MGPRTDCMWVKRAELCVLRASECLSSATSRLWDGTSNKRVDQAKSQLSQLSGGWGGEGAGVGVVRIKLEHLCKVSRT